MNSPMVGATALQNQNYKAIPASQQKKGAPFSGYIQDKPRFGSVESLYRGMSRVTNRNLMAISQRVVEVYLWGFLFNDFFNLQLPRFLVAPFEGFKPYDPSIDPANQGLTPLALAQKSVHENIKGMNWDNFNENFIREIGAGPGLMFIPAVMFSLARRMDGGDAVELGYGPLKSITHGFIEDLSKPDANLHHLVGKHKGRPVEKEVFKKAVKTYMKSLFDAHPAFLEREIQIGEPIIQMQPVKTGWQKLKRSLGILSYDVEPGRLAEKVKAGDVIHKIMDQMVETSYGNLSTKEKRQEVKRLKIWFTDTLMEVNYRHYPEEYHSFGDTTRQFKLSGNYDVADRVRVKRLEGWQPGGNLFDQLYNWLDYTKALHKKASVGYIDKSVSELARHTLNELLARKFVFGSLATAAGGIFLVWLTWTSQGHKKYTATRFMRYEDGQPVSNQENIKKAQPPQLSQIIGPSSGLITSQFASSPVSYPSYGTVKIPSSNTIWPAFNNPMQSFTHKMPGTFQQGGDWT
ncbi:MAG: hypothetical protein KTR14_08715 [Vampirovibrio sp.]|nr:hypothetical protein [Vampirovibrio sp.]